MTSNQLKKLADSLELDLKYVTKWEVPEDMRAVIGMPNIPKPLHMQNPRNLLGATMWGRIRKECYARADTTCEICGEKQEPGHCDAHEIYDIDYETGTATFRRAVCTCRLCHRYGIHTGRCVTLYSQDNPLMPKETLLAGAENAFTIISSYNREHPEQEPVRLYSTWIEYLKHDELREPMLELIKKYDVSFYMEDPKKTAPWNQWRLVFDGKEYPTPYKNEKEWKEAMKEAGKNDTARIYGAKKKKFTGLDSVEITEENIKAIEQAEVPEEF